MFNVKEFYKIGNLKDIDGNSHYEVLDKFKMGSYIIHNETENKYYVGVSSDLLRRLISHNIDRLFDKDSKYDVIYVYLYDTTKIKSTLRKLEESLLQLLVSNVSMDRIYNKQLKSNYPFYTGYSKKVIVDYDDNFYNDETSYIRSLQKYKIEDAKIPYDTEDLESEIDILNSRYNNEI